MGVTWVMVGNTVYAVTAVVIAYPTPVTCTTGVCDPASILAVVSALLSRVQVKASTLDASMPVQSEPAYRICTFVLVMAVPAGKTSVKVVPDTLKEVRVMSKVESVV